jgi:hypothetical protein
MDAIFVVVCLVVEGGQATRRRAWGWFPTAEEAEACVLKNDADVWENDYTHAVVERTLPGSLATVEGERWFRSVRDGYGRLERVETCASPEELEGICHFGMG